MRSPPTTPGRSRPSPGHDPPTVAGVTPANGAANVSLGTSVSATFSEAIAAASVTGTSFVLRDSGGNAVSASVSASGSTATLQPNASPRPLDHLHGDPPVRLERDQGTGRECARLRLQLVVHHGCRPVVPVLALGAGRDAADGVGGHGTAYELGVRFQSDVAGYITGIRFYKGSGNTGTHVGHCGRAPAHSLPRDVHQRDRERLAAGRLLEPGGDPGEHHLRRLLQRPRRPLRAQPAVLHERVRQPAATRLADGDGGGNGVYAVGTRLPEQDLPASNYWVDVVFATSVVDTTPRPSQRHSRERRDEVSLGTSVSATFSEPIAAASVTGTSFVLRDAGGNAVAASVSASGSTATLQPNASLARRRPTRPPCSPARAGSRTWPGTRSPRTSPGRSRRWPPTRRLRRWRVSRRRTARRTSAWGRA